MANRRAIPEGTQPRADVEIVGILKERPTCDFSVIRGCEVAQAVIEVNEMDLLLNASGEMAKQLSTFAAGTPLRIKGEVVMHEWTTDSKDRHSRVAFSVESLEKMA